MEKQLQLPDVEQQKHVDVLVEIKGLIKKIQSKQAANITYLIVDKPENAVKNWKNINRKDKKGNITRASFTPALAYTDTVRVSKGSQIRVTQFKDGFGIMHVDNLRVGDLVRGTTTTDNDFYNAYLKTSFIMALQHLEKLLLTPVQQTLNDGTDGVKIVSVIDSTYLVADNKGVKEQRVYKQPKQILSELVETFTEYQEDDLIPTYKKRLTKFQSDDEVDRFKLNEFVAYKDDDYEITNTNTYGDVILKSDTILSLDEPKQKSKYDKAELFTHRQDYRNPWDFVSGVSDTDEAFVDSFVSIFFGDSDSEYFKNTIGAILCNVTQRELQKFVFVQGLPGTGKTSLLELIFDSLLKNSAKKIDGFNSIFALNNNHGTSAINSSARVMWFDEMRFDSGLKKQTNDFTGLNVDSFKNLITSGDIYINRKYKEADTTRFNSIFMGATNNKPIINDANGDVNGLARRLLMLKIKDTTMFEKSQQIKRLINDTYELNLNEQNFDSDVNTFVTENAEMIATVFVKKYLDNPSLLFTAPYYGDSDVELPDALVEMINEIAGKGVDTNALENSILAILEGRASKVGKLVDENTLFINKNPKTFPVDVDDRQLIKEAYDKHLKMYTNPNGVEKQVQITIPGAKAIRARGYYIKLGV